MPPRPTPRSGATLASKHTSRNTHANGNENICDDTYASYHRTTRAARKERFIQAHHWGATVAEAARWAGIPVATLYRWRNQDPEFAQAWRGAQDKLVEGLEREAFQRAANGSERMLIFLLRSYKPGTYNQRQPEPPDPHHKCFTITDIAEKVRTWI